MNFSEAKKEAGRKICLLHPDKVLTALIVSVGDRFEYGLGCVSCKREGTRPVIGQRPSRIEERSKAMVGTALATREQRQERLATLDMNEVRTLLSLGKATNDEVRQFVLYCKAVDADPWAKEIYLIKYAEKDTAAIVLALNWYLKRASHNPLYESYQSGVTVYRAGQYIDVVGAVTYPGDVLFGGWCKVYKRGARVPFERRITMAEYDRHQFQWKTHPATMIEKVAIVQGVRRAFPDEFAVEEEAIPDLPVVLEGDVDVEDMPAAPPPPPAALPSGQDLMCPIHNVEWFKRGKMKFYAHPIGDTGKWCNMAQAMKAQDAQEPHQDTPEGPSDVPPVVDDSEPAQTLSFEQKKKMLFDWAEEKYGVVPGVVAAAAGITLDQITEATDLRWIANQVEAVYKTTE